MSKVRWGVLGAAKIATEKVIPAMQGGEHSEVVAIASRSAERASAVAADLGIPTSHGSYESLLADSNVDAIYNPLPNDLHAEWTIAAAEAGKHVLCEKPLGMDAGEAEAILAARDRCSVKIQEAFMVWTHPQWLRAAELCRSGRLGTVTSYTGYFSYYNDDPDNIRNIASAGGGALMDIGCYLIVTSRLIFGEEPRRVLGLMQRDPASGVDTLTSITLDFPSGQAIGTCSTRLLPHQRVQVFGSQGRLEIEVPFNAPNDRPCKLFVDTAGDLFGAEIETEEIDTCDQYRVQGDRFSRAILDDAEVPYPLEMSVRNMRLIDAVVRSAANATWEDV